MKVVSAHHIPCYRKPNNAAYRLHDVIQETVYRYMEVDISSDLSWGSHIDRITGTAYKTLRFVKRNIKFKSGQALNVRGGVRQYIEIDRGCIYTTFVRPQLEYAAAIWVPNHNEKIDQIDKVKRRAACWIDGMFSSVFR